MPARRPLAANILFWILYILGMAFLASAIAHGQTVNDPSKASENTAILQKQAEGGWISLSKPGTYYINDAIKLPAKIGARVTSKGAGSGYWYPGDHPSKLAVNPTRICQLKDNTPAFILKGAGAVFSSPLTIEGKGNAAAIEIEGRAGPVASGRHRFVGLSFYNWDAAFKTLAGYYQADGTLQADENHADNCYVEGCEFMNVKRILWSQNQQAVNWFIDHSVVGWTGGAPPDPVVAADIERGGKVHFNGLEVCTPRLTIFKVRDFSPNNNYLTCRDFSFDRQPYSNAWLTLIEYTGPESYASWSKWGLRIEGTVHQVFTDAQLYKIPAAMPRDTYKVDLFTVYK